MVSSLYTAASGMIAQGEHLDVISNNLANVSTVAYKKDRITFSNYFIHSGLIPGTSKKYERDEESPIFFDSQNAVVFADKHYVDFSAGPIKETGRDLDVAIDGDGFFMVEGPGGILFTRAGNFYVMPDGTLRTPDGYLVLGRVAPVMPPEPIVVDPRQKVVITTDGYVMQNNNRLFRLEIRKFDEPLNNFLEKFGYNYFRPKDLRYTGELINNMKVLPGFLEGSNADVVREMVNLINCYRHYEACQKAIRVTFEDITSRTVTDVGRVG